MTMVSLILAVALAAALVRAVMWRLEWLERRPVTPRMKRGQRRSWWPLIPAVLALAGGLWWLDYPELARYLVAGSAGAPFLLATERLWARVLRLDTTGWAGKITMSALLSTGGKRWRSG
jgi:hypothetical protein